VTLPALGFGAALDLIKRIPAWLWACLLLAITAAVMAWLWQSAAHDLEQAHSDIQIKQSTIDARDRSIRALESAAAKRDADDREQAARDKEITDAIKKAAVPGTAPGPAAVAHGCERLRRQGSTASPEYQRICGRR
jgi:hypothetical protein